jgi:putative flavoprotein involved in K+ transport
MSDEAQAVKAWLEAFQQALDGGAEAEVADLFHDDCFWRDLVVMSWNIVTVEGHEGVRELVSATRPTAKPRNLRLSDRTTNRAAPAGVVQGWFDFETDIARGVGIVRLRDGKVWTLLTSIDELIDFEEASGNHRPLGAAHGASKDRTTWLEARQSERALLQESREPYVLIVGGGQGGICVAARLRQLGVPTLIIDSKPRPGDTWRSRYRSLCLHDAVWFDHLPYLEFPSTWPIYTPKDKMGDWLEHYVDVMELNYDGATTCESASWDALNQRWDVTVSQGGRRTTLHPTQLVVATGLSGRPKIPQLPGRDVFAGLQQHSSEHTGDGDYLGKKVVVVGSNNSAHDIAAAMWENGADVTMVQRSSTLVVTVDAMRNMQAGLYSEAALADGVDLATADLLTSATPFRLVPAAAIPVWTEIREADSALYDGLEEAGFMLDFGTDGSGLGMKYLSRAGGYYINVGASELLVSGEIKLRSNVGIERLTRTGLVLSTGEELPADVIVYATGFGPVSETIADLLSPAIAEKVGPVWGLGSDRPGDPGPWEGELRNVWKPTSVDNLWIHAGNLQQSRVYSRYLALQIKARYEKLPVEVYSPTPQALGRTESMAS